jgi:hypothetical protein
VLVDNSGNLIDTIFPLPSVITAIGVEVGPMGLDIVEYTRSLLVVAPLYVNPVPSAAPFRDFGLLSISRVLSDVAVPSDPKLGALDELLEEQPCKAKTMNVSSIGFRYVVDILFILKSI